MSEREAEAYYVEHGWSGCAGSAWDRLTEATRDGWRHAAHVARATADAEALAARLEVWGDQVSVQHDALHARLTDAEARLAAVREAAQYDRCADRYLIPGEKFRAALGPAPTTDADTRRDEPTRWDRA